MYMDRSDFIAQCYVVYGNYIKRIIQKYVSNKDEIEDIFHEVFLRLLNRQFNADVHSSLVKYYIGKTTRNLCIIYLRKKTIECHHYNEMVNKTIEPIYELKCYNAEEAAVEGMVINTLYDVIKELEDDEQSVLFGKYYHDKKLTEMAQEQNVTYYFMRKKIKDIHNKLKHKLQNYSIYGQRDC